MDSFSDLTNSGNEPSIKRGTKVPDGDVNIAWVETPKLTPKNNVFILDTSGETKENTRTSTHKTKVMYSNSVGILEDKFGNQLVTDEYPCVTDVFTKDEDYLTVLGDEYSDEDVLPYHHVSRYFHADSAGLVNSNGLHTYTGSRITVISDDGSEYVDVNGFRLYKIKISRLPDDVSLYYPDSSTGIYRVHVFARTLEDTNLSLSYNKVEIASDGSIKGSIVGHSEALNLQPYFKYVPEETDVVDVGHYKDKVYSTKPISRKEALLGLPNSSVDGYKVYVPKKAIPDPRLYQLFRWRVKCDFAHEHYIPTNNINASSSEQVNVGVISTGLSGPTNGDYVFFNLENSSYNKSNISFVNPLATTNDKKARVYWRVDIDTLSDADISKYDVLVYSPISAMVDMSGLVSKLNYFTNVAGGTLIVDTGSVSVLHNFGAVVSDTYGDSGGVLLGGDAVGFSALRSNSPVIPDSTDELLSALSSSGGWDIPAAENDSLCIDFSGLYSVYMQGIQSYPSDYTSVIEATNIVGGTSPVLIRKTGIGDTGSSRGRTYFSTMPFLSSINSFYNTDGTQSYDNYGDNISITSTYDSNVGSPYVQGAYKLLYNMVAYATKGKPVPVSIAASSFSSAFSVYSDWKADWAIDGSALLEREKSDNKFALLPKDLNGDTSLAWQKQLSGKDLSTIIDDSMSESYRLYSRDAVRVYSIETTNRLVLASDSLDGNDTPKVWTDAYSPGFTIPLDMGPNVLRSELVHGDYEPSQYSHKSFPPKKYDLEVQATYLDDYTVAEDITTTYTVSGYITKTTKYQDQTIVTPPTQTTSTKTVTRDEQLLWSTHGSGTTILIPENPWAGAPRPSGINTMQELNYYSSSTSDAWPYWGMRLQHSTSLNSTGEAVKTIQASLNQFKFWNVISLGAYLVEDGIFGPKTRSATLLLQNTMGAKFKDGVVGAETWGIIGMMILRVSYAMDLLGGNGKATLTGSADPYKKPWADIYRLADMKNISNGNTSTAFAKRSWISGGPDIIYDTFNVIFSGGHNIHTVVVTPYVEGSSSTCMINNVGVFSTVQSMSGFDTARCQLSNLPNRGADGQKVKFPIGPIPNAKQIVVTLGQDKASGAGTSRILGVRDIMAYAQVTDTVTSTQTTPGGTSFQAGDVKVENIPFTVNGTITVNSTGKKIITISTPQIPEMLIASTDPTVVSETYGDYQYTSISAADPNVNAAFDATSYSNGTKKVIFSTSYMVAKTSTYVLHGDRLPTSNGSFTYHAKDVNNNISPAIEAGWITKRAGLKLFCDTNGDPVGIPILPPSVDRPESAFIKLYGHGTDSLVRYGFYDSSLKEFVTSGYGGDQTLSYLEYMRRGPNNIFIAAVTEYEVTEIRDMPMGDDAPPMPRLWAMPVYGICNQISSRIGIEPLPANLGPMDLWPIPIRIGSFVRTVNISSKYAEIITHWSKAYEGDSLMCHYNIPEADSNGWSLLHGRPNVDIIDEIPDILSDTVIRVRQTPILMLKEPESYPSLADSVKPILKIYTRADVSSPWNKLGWSAIRDYDVNTGVIDLALPLDSIDTNLIKVSYTTNSRVYDFKSFGNNKINLNPYITSNETIMGVPIYVYIVPQYAYDSNGVIVASSIETNTLRWTTDPGIFNLIDSAIYNPLAIKIGVVIISNSADIKQLVIRDTRTRGGGIDEQINSSDLKNDVKYTDNYWDINYGFGESYQSGGYVLIRLPEELKTRFEDDSLVRLAVNKNMPIGSAYGIEDSNGNPWR